MSDTVTRRLQVVGCEAVYQGENSKGEYTIYEVAALDENGEQVDQNLRSFDLLSIDGELREFEVTPYDGKNGRSYTLKLPGQGGQKSPGARLGPKVDVLREEVDVLQTQVGELNRRLAELEGRLQTAPSAGLMSRTSAASDDEDIPF